MNSHPFDAREKRDFLEVLAFCIADGRTAGAGKRIANPDVRVFWSEAGLHVEKIGGIRVAVLVPQTALELLLRSDDQD